MTEIPTTKDFPDYEQATDLGDVLYLLRFYWNGRDESWYVTISTAAGEPIIHGAKLRRDWPALSRFVDERLPAGPLIPVAVAADAPAEPGRNDLTLGGNYALTFIPSAEAASVAAG